MSVVTRFAPSPTGRLHVGNIRTALHNLPVRAEAWRRPSSCASTTPTASARPPSSIRRSATISTGSASSPDKRGPPVGAVRPLRARVRAAEGGRPGLCLLRNARGARPSPQGAARPRAAAGLRAQAGRTRRCRKAASPHWRFRLDHDRPIAWTDLIRGEQKFDPKLLSDPVVRREDGSWLYLLPSVIDDVDLGVTHVVRGEDHVSNSAAQIQMFEALGAQPPHFAHEALLVAAEGKLSKRLGLLRRRAGARPRRRADGAAVGAGADRHVAAGRAVRIARRTGRALRLLAPSAARRRTSTRTRSSWSMPGCSTSSTISAVADRLPGRRDRGGLAAAARQPRATDDFAGWLAGAARRHRRRPSSATTSALLVKEAAAIAARPRLGRASLARAHRTPSRQSTGKKGRELFHPLRLALTGRDSGPEMAGLLAVHGQGSRRPPARRRSQALERLRENLLLRNKCNDVTFHLLYLR